MEIVTIAQEFSMYITIKWTYLESRYVYTHPKILATTTEH